jgi:hypothetical protein|tara:strand:+ start:4274 stop:5026 length:753 start_codon:yes stop_codon:yes gene_type:complete
MGVILRYKDFLQTYKTRSHRIRHLKDYKYLFPIKASETLAGIIADLICDGNLQGNPKWRIDYTSKSIEELKRFEKEIKFLFDKKGKIRKCTTNKFGKTYNLAVNCSPISRILFLCGTPAGQKVLTSFKVPNWIKKDKKYFRRFAQRVFSCEGGIMYEPHRKLPQIRMSMWKAENVKEKISFIDELAIYLNQYFNIKSTVTKGNNYNVRKDSIITRPLKMYIISESVIKFRKEIGFEGEKQEKLNKIMGVS